MFLGTHTSKVDGKNRASVPASFRSHILAAAPDFKGVAVFPSLKKSDPAYIGCDASYLTILDRRIREGDFDPDEADAMARAIFSDAEMLPFDDGGRVVLSKELRGYVGIETEALFIGKGLQTFEVWSPEAYAARPAPTGKDFGANALSIMFNRGGRTSGGAHD